MGRPENGPAEINGWVVQDTSPEQQTNILPMTLTNPRGTNVELENITFVLEIKKRTLVLYFSNTITNRKFIGTEREQHLNLVARI